MSNIKEKSKVKIAIIILIIVIAIIFITVHLVKNNKNEVSYEEVIDTYISAFNALADDTSENSIDEIISTLDLKAACAWENCEGNTEEFPSVYKETTDEDISSYEETLREEYNTIKNQYGTYLSYYKMSRDESIDAELENIANTDGLVRVKVTIIYKMATIGNEDNEQSTSDSTYFYFYNGKIIAIEKAPNEETAEVNEDIE